MRLIQFQLPKKGRRIGYIDGEHVVDLTSINAGWTRIYSLFLEARRSGKTIGVYLAATSTENADRVLYNQLLTGRQGDASGWILPPLDHPDPAHCTVSGTGLTHLGSMEARDQMHTIADTNEATKTDSQKMFEMGLRGGKPAPGERGIQPEWFYKGNGTVLRGPQRLSRYPRLLRRWWRGAGNCGVLRH